MQTIDLQQRLLPFNKRAERPRLAPWQVAPEVEAQAMIAWEKKNADRVQGDFIDMIVRLYAKKGDRVKFRTFEDGRHMLVNGEDVGMFPTGREFVWREARKQ